MRPEDTMLASGESAQSDKHSTERLPVGVVIGHKEIGLALVKWFDTSLRPIGTNIYVDTPRTDEAIEQGMNDPSGAYPGTDGMDGVTVQENVTDRLMALSRKMERENIARADALLQVSEHARRLEEELSEWRRQGYVPISERAPLPESQERIYMDTEQGMIGGERRAGTDRRAVRSTSGLLANSLLKDLVEHRELDQAVACTQSSYPDIAARIREWLGHYRADSAVQSATTERS